MLDNVMLTWLVILLVVLMVQLLLLAMFNLDLGVKRIRLHGRKFCGAGTNIFGAGRCMSTTRQYPMHLRHRLQYP